MTLQMHTLTALQMSLRMHVHDLDRESRMVACEGCQKRNVVPWSAPA
jgi:hypothetical protein